MTPLHDDPGYSPGLIPSLIPSNAGLTITGITTGYDGQPLEMPVLAPNGSNFGRPAWYHHDGTHAYDCYWDGSVWSIGAKGHTQFSSGQNMATPDMVTMWTPNGGAAGDPVARIGQDSPGDPGSLAGADSATPTDPGSLLPPGTAGTPGAVGPLAPAAPAPPAPGDAVRYVAQSLNSGQQARARANIGAAAEGLSGRCAGELCTIPTHDGNPSLTHPTVVFAREGWNGFPYWMAHTPYPAGEREIPNIVASMDGQQWVVPPGGSNPIAPIGAGFNYCADPELVLLPDNSLACFFIKVNSGTSRIVHFRTISTDGITWSTPVEVMDSDEDPNVGGCPAIVVNDDGTLTMWHAYDPAATGLGVKIGKRTSSDDGFTWSAVTECTLPDTSDFNPWHFSIRRNDGGYHMLLMNDLYYGAHKGRQFYLASSDGLVWTGDLARPAIPQLSARDHHTYKSAFAPVPGFPDRWDVWLVGMPEGYGTTTPSSLTHPWRIRLLRDVVLPTRKRSVAEVDFIRLLENTLDIPMARALWKEHLVGTGTVETTSPQGLFLRTGTTANSSVFVHPFYTSAYSTPAIVPGDTFSTNRHKARVRYSVTLGAIVMDANAVMQVVFGLTPVATAMAIPFANAGVGFKVANNRLILLQHNGTTLSEDDVATISANLKHVVTIEAHGDGTASIELNGVVHGPFDGGPHAYDATYLDTPSVYLGNGATTSNEQVFISKVMITRFP